MMNYMMKAAVSIPADVFDEAERLARTLHTSRSRLYAQALAEFIARHDQARLTELMNKALNEIEPEADSFVTKASQTALERNEW